MVDIKAVARKVIQDETEAIQNLISYIDDDFEAVVKLIYENKGRVIITGIGKSAIIATKIVATMNSTGTPAVFMHAADAIHGDLGMIREEDVVICVSKSGNTPEIKVLIPLIRNNGNNNIVAMVSNTDSFLAKNSLYVLKAKVEKRGLSIKFSSYKFNYGTVSAGRCIGNVSGRMSQFFKQGFCEVSSGGKSWKTFVHEGVGCL